MSYIRDNLTQNEKILFSARIHPALFLPAIVVFILTATITIYSLRMAVEVGSPGIPPAPVSGVGFISSLMLCISGFLFLYSILLGLRALIVILTTEFSVTNKRVMAKTGFIRRHTLELLLPKVESIAVHQGILGRLLNFGTVTVTGTGGTSESFRAIVDPITVRRKINQILESNMKAYAENLLEVSSQKASI